MRLALVCFYCLCVFVYVLYFIATMSFAGYFLSVLLCLLSMLISDSRFDLVWFRLSCDHGCIRSGSVNVRKQQQQQHSQGRAGGAQPPAFGALVHPYFLTASCPDSDLLPQFGVLSFSVWTNTVRLPILLVVSWTEKMNISRSSFAPGSLVSRNGFGRPVPRQPAHSPHSG